MIWPSRGIVFVASNKSTWTSSRRSGSGLRLVSASNAALDSHSIFFARRRRKICSTASASAAMRCWLWLSVKRFRQQASKYTLTSPLFSPPQYLHNKLACRSAHLNVWSGNQTTVDRKPRHLSDEVSLDRAASIIKNRRPGTLKLKPYTLRLTHNTILQLPSRAIHRARAREPLRLLTNC